MPKTNSITDKTMMSKTSSDFVFTRLPSPLGKRGSRWRGLQTRIKKAEAKGKDVTKLYRKALRIPIYSCCIDHQCFKYESQLFEHYSRYHTDAKAFTRLITPGVGYVCKVCGSDSIKYADSRALKKHYRDRSKHSAKEVITAKVLLEVVNRGDEEDLRAVKEVYEDAELLSTIEEVAEDKHEGEKDTEEQPSSTQANNVLGFVEKDKGEVSSEDDIF